MCGGDAKPVHFGQDAGVPRVHLHRHGNPEVGKLRPVARVHEVRRTHRVRLCGLSHRNLYIDREGGGKLFYIHAKRRDI